MPIRLNCLSAKSTIFTLPYFRLYCKRGCEANYAERVSGGTQTVKSTRKRWHADTIKYYKLLNMRNYADRLRRIIVPKRRNI